MIAVAKSFDALPNEIIQHIIAIHPKRVWFLLNKRINKLACDTIDPGARDNYAIGFAATHGYVNLVKRLLQDDRVDPGVHNNYALRMASKHGYASIVKMLLQHPKVDPSLDPNNHALVYAAFAGHLDIVELFLSNPKVDAAMCISLARRGWFLHYPEVVERLLMKDRSIKYTGR
jgi:ankyrin repeat protein